MTQKSTLVIALALVATAGFTIAKPQFASLTPDNQFLVRTTVDDMERSSSSFKLNANGARRLKVDLEFAEVEVETVSGSELTAEVTKEVNKPLDAEERRWLEADWIQAKREGDTLVISEDKSKKPDLNGRTTKNRNINLKVVIHVPRGLDANLDIAAGTVKMEGSYRSLKGHIAAGQFSTSNFSSDQFVDLDLEAGEIDAKLDKVPSGASKIEVNVGEISLDMKGNANVDASVGIGSIEVPGESSDRRKGLGSHQEIRIGSGGTKFSLRIDAGTINLGQGKTEKHIDTGDEFDMNLDLDADIDQAKDLNIDVDGELSKDIQKEIESALRIAERETKAALKEAERAMKDVRFEIDRDMQKDIEKAMKEANKDAATAMAEAERELKKAQIEMNKDKNFDKNLSPNVREITRSAMKIAREAMAMANEAVQKALKKSSKDKGNEPS